MGKNTVIRKPDFILPFLTNFAASIIICWIVGLLIYMVFKTQYDQQIQSWMQDSYATAVSSIRGNTNWEEITSEDIVRIKSAILAHYNTTGQRCRVVYDKEVIADTQKTAILYYCTDDMRQYRLELADDKYLDDLLTPQVTAHERSFTSDLDVFTGVKIKGAPVITFECCEFYADLENCRFIPAVTYIYEVDEETGEERDTGTKVVIEPDDVEGYTLIKDPADSFANRVAVAYGMIEGYSGEDKDSDYTVNSSYTDDYGKVTRYWFTEAVTPDFNETYGTYITAGKIIFVLLALFSSAGETMIRYNRDLRRYEIYEYRRKTTDAMAHDLKTPLASISAYAENLENHVGTDKQEHYAAKIREKVDQMNRMVNSILEFSRSENAGQTISKSVVNIGKLVQDIVDENEQLTEERGLKVSLDEQEKSVVQTDKDLLAQALGNLIGNAVRYSKEGSTIHIKVTSGYIKITNVMEDSISDAKDLKEPFVKGDSSRSRGGTGLGLAIADNDLAMLKYKLDIRTEGELFICTVLL